MSNISFDNPYLLIIGLVLLVLLFISFFVSIKKESFNFHNVGSLVLHAVIIVLVSLCLAGMKLERVVTETNVYVMADVSYSSIDNYEKIDEYIEDLKDNLPRNSKLGVVAFGKDHEILVELGSDLVSVKNTKVDTSETNIFDALNFTASLFNDNVIKRIVLITDGYDTNNQVISGLADDLESKEIFIDAIYLDNNLKPDDKEIQISDVRFDDKAYVDSESLVDIVIESNTASKAVVRLYKDDLLFSETVEALNEGMNTVTMKTDTESEGSFTYKAELSDYTEDNEVYDNSKYNNNYLFTQEVLGNVKVLFISEEETDKEEFDSIYDSFEYDVTYYVGNKDVPYLLEELCTFDEIVISNTDVSKLNNADAFVSNLEIAVSEFGKSLVTLGNTYIQNGEDNEILIEFGSILPVKFDNNDNNRKLYTLILDISKSMNQISHFIMAKESACAIIDMLDENYDLLVVAFYADVEIVFNIDKMTPTNKELAKKEIMSLEAKQATSISAGLSRTLSLVEKLNYYKKEAILISDGRAYSLDEDKSTETATKLAEANVHVSVIYTANTESDSENSLLKAIASNGNGNYYQVYDKESAKNLILTTIADKITENHKYGDFSVSIVKTKDELVDKISGKPENISEFFTCILKPTASSIIDVYEKSTSYPLYSTWSYGNGFVSSLASSITGNAMQSWRNDDSVGQSILSNVIDVNMPKLQVYSPFIFNLEQNGNKTDVIINAPVATDKAKMELTVVDPNNNEAKYEMAFDSMNYFVTIDTSLNGKYVINLKYSQGNIEFIETKDLCISYNKEYNEFQKYDPSNLYSMVNHNGKVSEDGKLSINNDGMDLQLYTYEFMPLFMIICVVLFICDVIIRKLRWQDIVSLFKKNSKGMKR